MKNRSTVILVAFILNLLILLGLSFRVGMIFGEMKVEREHKTLIESEDINEPTLVKDTVPYIIEIPEISMETGRYSVTVRLVDADSLTDSDVEYVRNYISDTYVIGSDYQLIIEK